MFLQPKTFSQQMNTFVLEYQSRIEIPRYSSTVFYVITKTTDTMVNIMFSYCVELKCITW